MLRTACCEHAVAFRHESARFTQGQQCYWYLEAGSGYNSQVTFTSLALTGQDAIEVYDGPTTASPLLVTLTSGYSAPYVVHGYSVFMTIALVVDQSGDGAQFSATMQESTWTSVRGVWEVVFGRASC